MIKIFHSFHNLTMHILRQIRPIGLVCFQLIIIKGYKMLFNNIQKFHKQQTVDYKQFIMHFS